MAEEDYLHVLREIQKLKYRLIGIDRLDSETSQHNIEAEKYNEQLAQPCPIEL